MFSAVNRIFYILIWINRNQISEGVLEIDWPNVTLCLVETMKLWITLDKALPLFIVFLLSMFKLNQRNWTCLCGQIMSQFSLSLSLFRVAHGVNVSDMSVVQPHTCKLMAVSLALFLIFFPSCFISVTSSERKTKTK
jgi:hypothetical protein